MRNCFTKGVCQHIPSLQKRSFFSAKYWYFFNLPRKHVLRLLIRSALPRRFWWVLTTNVFCKTLLMGTKACFCERLLRSTHNISFHGETRKIFVWIIPFILSYESYGPLQAKVFELMQTVQIQVILLMGNVQSGPLLSLPSVLSNDSVSK